MKKITAIFFLLLLLFNMNTPQVKAESIDVNKSSSIEITHKYGDIKIPDTTISIYTIAKLTETGTYEFQEHYQEISFDPTGMSSSQQNLKAKEILEYISKNVLEATATTKTNQEGIVNFTNLVPGLYLIQIENKTLNNYQYSALPSLISIPILENSTYQYDIKINTKTEQAEITQEEIPKENENISVPNTLDNIVFYMILLGISLLVIIGVLYYISKIEKKGKKENEKNNK